MDSHDSTAMRCQNVSKTFRTGNREVTALNDLTIDVQREKITGLIGPDGAGKTTLMRLAAGLLHADTGSVTVLGLNAARDSLKVQASVGYMPQRFGLYEDLSVQENLDLYADLQGLPIHERPDRYAELMRMTGLAPFTKRLAGKLSGGMRQKLGLACTLVRPPRLLLLDEPTVGVDPVSRRELWVIVDRFVKEEGTTVLLSTAYLDEAERCENVIMLDQGQLIGQGPPEQFSQPLTGRTFHLHSSDRNNRDLQARVTGRPGVLDAVIQGEAVRLVLAEDAPTTVEALLPGEQHITLEPVPPRFEDGFITMLRERRDPVMPGTNSITNPPTSDAESPRKDGTVISVRDVQRRFGSFYAVKGVSFDVHRGEIFGLLGANGAGKTTMFRMLCGLLPASNGSLQVAGVDVRKTAAAARARIGYMSQKFSLYGTLSVDDNLQFFSSAYGLAGQRRRDRIDWATSEFELKPVLDNKSGDLPLGYKQRLALACALMHEPEIIFLDEPTSGVDPLARREFWQRINALASANVTVLVTTHFMEEAEYCDRLAIMMAGEVLSLGTPREIKQHASTDETPDPSMPVISMEDAFIHLIETQTDETIESGTP
ncbi:ATP-binding cassette domain-containing protein [Gimesia panareensis]|uniref:ATP-binding cassette domain-containing protein n=1 Tax=Gimesia panareensis TaxID=2527978 RepID=UPI001188277C|nr:ATP-binding cassette domain-containing protein [Gimesia panareensis]QDU52258.1 putative ABC transporter ATP-binding protein YbhF [Gimesia panareensis]